MDILESGGLLPGLACRCAYLPTHALGAKGISMQNGRPKSPTSPAPWLKAWQKLAAALRRPSICESGGGLVPCGSASTVRKIEQLPLPDCVLGAFEELAQKGDPTGPMAPRGQVPVFGWIRRMEFRSLLIFICPCV